MKRTWLIPLIIFILLAVAWGFRWEYPATKAVDGGIVKWKVDRWSGETFMETYGAKKAGEVQIQSNSYSWLTRDVATAIWMGGMVASVLWLAYLVYIGPAIRRSREREDV